MTATQLDSIDSVRMNALNRDSTSLFPLETLHEDSVMTNDSRVENSSTFDLSNNLNQSGDIQFLLCKFLVALITSEEHLMRAKADFLDLRFDLENRFARKFSPVMLF